MRTEEKKFNEKMEKKRAHVLEGSTRRALGIGSGDFDDLWDAELSESDSAEEEDASSPEREDADAAGEGARGAAELFLLAFGVELVADLAIRVCRVSVESRTKKVNARPAVLDRFISRVTLTPPAVARVGSVRTATVKTTRTTPRTQ